MVRLKNNLQKVSLYFVRDFNNPRTTQIFFKALILFTLVKILMLWSFSQKVMEHHNITLPRSWLGKIILGPSFLANYDIDIFYTVAVIFLVIAFFLRSHYITTLFLFWLTFNLYVVYLTFVNGADLVLFMLALWCIPMATRPELKSTMGHNIQKASYNTALVLCQLQVVFIYLVSGWDKLFSKTWQSGVAFDYIAHLNTLYNPFFLDVFDIPGLHQIFSWITILFELAFAVLVWFDKTRIPMLVIGILFHLFIWIVMSLPDFAVIMILSYIIFLKDEDYNFLRIFSKPSLP